MKTVLYTDVLYRAAELAGRTRDKLPLSEALMLQGSIAVELEDVWNRAIWPELNPDPLNVILTNRKFSKNEGASGVTVVNNDLVDVDFTFTRPGLTPLIVPVAAGATASVDDLVAESVEVNGVSADIPLGALFSGTITWDVAPGGSGGTITVAQTIPMGDIIIVLSADPHATTKYHALGFQEQDDEVWVDEGRASVWVDFVLPAPDLMALSGSDLNNYKIPQRFRNYLQWKAAAMLLGADGQAATAGAFLGMAEAALTTQLQRLPSPPEWRQVRMRTGYARKRFGNSGAVGTSTGTSTSDALLADGGGGAILANP